MLVKRQARLEQAHMLSPTVRYLRLRMCDAEPLTFKAGQWINIYAEHNGEHIRRSYSIASSPKFIEPGCFDLAVTRVEAGVASTALHALQLGAEVTVENPLGLFTREAAHRGPAALFVATGTGLSPFRAMLQEELQDREGPRMVLLFGCRTEDDILWRAEFEAFAAANPRFTLICSLSRASESWKGHRGYVQTHVKRLVAELSEPAPPHVYICGLSHMVNEVRRILKEEVELDRKHVHSERYD